MIIAVDFDGTVVNDMSAPWGDLTQQLEFMPGAQEALHALKAAGHTLLLYSGRANRALRVDPTLDPLVRAGKKPVDWDVFNERKHVAQQLFEQMIQFVESALPGVFDAIDDGLQGKPSADLFLDDRTPAGPIDWWWVAGAYGALPDAAAR